MLSREGPYLGAIHEQHDLNVIIGASSGHGETSRRFCDSSNVWTWYVRACRLVARAVSQPVAVLAASSAASTPHPLSSWQQRALHTAQLGHDTAAAAGQDTAAAAGHDTAAAAGHGPWVRKIWMRRVCCISLVWSLATSHSS